MTLHPIQGGQMSGLRCNCCKVEMLLGIVHTVNLGSGLVLVFWSLKMYFVQCLKKQKRQDPLYEAK